MPTILSETTITPRHRCGHEVRQRRNTAAARAYAAELAQEDCYGCRRIATDAAASDMAHTLRLPELTGTEKQIRWAMSVREDRRQAIETAYPAPSPDTMACADALLYGIADAGWWIDHRDASATALVDWMAPIVAIVRASAR